MCGERFGVNFGAQSGEFGALRLDPACWSFSGKLGAFLIYLVSCRSLCLKFKAYRPTTPLFFSGSAKNGFSWTFCPSSTHLDPCCVGLDLLNGAWTISLCCRVVIFPLVVILSHPYLLSSFKTVRSWSFVMSFFLPCLASGGSFLGLVF